MNPGGLRKISTGLAPFLRTRAPPLARGSRRGLCNNAKVTREIVPPPLQPSSPDHGKVTNTGKIFVGLTFVTAIWITKRYMDGKFEPIPGVHTPLEFDKEGDLVIPELNSEAFPDSVVIPGGFKQNKYTQETAPSDETKQ